MIHVQLAWVWSITIHEDGGAITFRTGRRHTRAEAMRAIDAWLEKYDREHVTVTGFSVEFDSASRLTTNER